MKLPFTGRTALGCPTCHGQRQVVMTAFVMGKGKQLVSRPCPSCSGKGKLKRR